jgi:hypothetical protein
MTLAVSWLKGMQACMVGGRKVRNTHDGCVASELDVAQCYGGAMVPTVEEGQGLLLDSEENSVEQLDVFDQVINLSRHQSIVAHEWAYISVGSADLT